MESKPELKPESKPELKSELKSELESKLNPTNLFKIVYKRYETFECEKDEEKDEEKDVEKEFEVFDKYVITPTGDICHKISIVEKSN